MTNDSRKNSIKHEGKQINYKTYNKVLDKVHTQKFRGGESAEIDDFKEQTLEYLVDKFIDLDKKLDERNEIIRIGIMVRLVAIMDMFVKQIVYLKSENSDYKRKIEHFFKSMNPKIRYYPDTNNNIITITSIQNPKKIQEILRSCDIVIDDCKKHVTIY